MFRGSQRPAIVGLLQALFCLALGACTLPDNSGDECTPRCDGRACGTDGCGGSCGTCLPGSTCTDGLCIADDARPDCTQSCTDLGYTCGEHCGTSCGACGPTQECSQHTCVCKPDCDGRTCGDNDGCGGTCGPCPTDRNCIDCELRLIALTDETVGGHRIVTLAVDFNPLTGRPLAGMMDLRVQVVGDATLERVGLGPVLTAHDKELLVHPYTGKPFQLIRDGVYRVVVTSPRNADRIPGGRWLFLRFRVDDDTAQFRLLREASVFAPAAANLALGDAPFAGSVVLGRGSR